jgi:predicted RNase H-like HicB family nuclease
MAKSKKVKVLEYNAIFAPEDGGGFSVHVPNLPGCISEGDTFEEAEANIKEAIELYLEDADESLFHITPETSRKEFLAPISVRIQV